MCDEAPVRGNATISHSVPMHGNATTSYIVPMHGNALTLDSILAENMIGAGVIPGPLPYCGRSMPLRLGFGPPSRVGKRANPQVGAQLIPFFGVIARHRVKAEKSALPSRGDGGGCFSREAPIIGHRRHPSHRDFSFWALEGGGPE